MRKTLCAVTALLAFLQTTTACLAQQASSSGTFDLSSGDTNQQAPGSAQLNLGGNITEVQAGAAVTAGMYAAIADLMSGSKAQGLTLNSSGVATGGHFQLGNLPGNVFIPANVSALTNAATGPINISGNLSNAGSIIAYSTSAANTQAVINAASIVNQMSGFIGTGIPVISGQAISGATANIGLLLHTSGALANYGTISSLGDLHIAAGGSVTNGPSAIMQATGNLNIMSSVGQLVNAGTIASIAGNVNLSTSVANSLVLTNLQGTIQALNGTIFMNGSTGVAAIGGNLASQVLEVVTANGPAVLQTDSISGSVNVSADIISVAVANGELNLGKICSEGDPTFYNTAGGVKINTDLVFPGQPLAIVASSNITVGAGAGKIDTSSSTGNGGNILMLAGVDFTSSGGPTSTDPFAPVTLSITGPSASGGKIALDGKDGITMLSSRSTSANGKGGDINLNAFAGELPDSGQIRLPQNVTLMAGGNGTGANGRIRVIAGATSGTAITMGDADTTGGATGTGVVGVLATKVEVAAGGATITNGDLVVPSSIFAGVANTNPASILGGNLKCNGCTMIIASKSDVSLQSATADALGSGNGGSVRIDTASSNQFIVGAGTKVNGVAGIISAKGGPTGGKGGTITFTIYGSGGFSLPDPSKVSVKSFAGAGGTFQVFNNLLGFDAKGLGPLFIGSGTIDVSAGGGNTAGGTLVLQYGDDFSVGNTGALNLLANASGTGTGGTIQLLWNGVNSKASPSNIVIGGGAGEITAFARGGSVGSAAGNGGRIDINAGRYLTVNPAFLDASPRGNNGAGAYYTVVSGRPFVYAGSPAGSDAKLTINGNLNADGKGTGAGGTIVLASADSGLFTIGGAAGCKNCATGTLTANSGAAGGAGGKLFLESYGDLTVIDGSKVSATATSGGGGSIRFSLGGGKLSIGSGAVRADAGGAGNFTGGTIVLEALYLDTGTGISLSANGVGGGNGGTVYVDAPGSYLSIDPTGTSLKSLSATGGSAGSTAGNGGLIFVQAKGLTADTAAINANPLGTNGSGGILEFHAVDGLVVNGDSNLSGKGTGSGGTIYFDTTYIDGADSNRFQMLLYGKTGVSSPDPFIINGAAGCKNCTTGRLIANSGASGGGGWIFVSNTNDLFAGSLSNFSLSTKSGAGARLELISKSGTVHIGAGTLDLSAGGAGNFSGGTLTLSGANLDIQAGSLNVVANAQGGGNGGTVTIAANGAGSDLILPAFTVTARGGSAGSTSGNGGTVTVKAGRDLTLDPSSISAGPQGTNGNGASYIFTAGRTLTLTGGVSVQANGTGNGGVINLSGNAATAFAIGGPVGCTNCVAGALIATGGAVSGAAGTISVSNSGGVNLNDFANLQLSATKGAGGTLSIAAANGTVSVPGGILSLDAAGIGNFDGGKITFTGDKLDIQGGKHLSLSANAAGTGNGGSLSVSATSSTANLAVGKSGQTLSFSAQGGSPGSTAGDGGSVFVLAGGNLDVDPASISAGPLGLNGKGANISLTAGGALHVNGDLAVNGKGTGAGGTLSIGFGTIDLTIGSSGAGSFVNGKLSASPAGTGGGGAINILGPVSGSLFTVQLAGKVDAGSSGAINLRAGGSQTAKSIIINGPDTLTGRLNVTANSIFVSLPSKSPVTLGTVSALNGPLQISIPSINIPNGSVVSATNGSVLIQSGTIINNGVIRASTPGYGVVVSNPGGVTITGAGVILGTNVTFISSSGSVNVSQGGIVGAVSGSAAGTFDVGQSVLLTSGGVSNNFVSTQAVTSNTLTFNLLQPITVQLVQQDQASHRRTSLYMDASGENGDDPENSQVTALSGEIFYVNYTNQALNGFIASSDTLSFADEGTVAGNDGIAVLHKGRVIIDTGAAESTTVATSRGKLKIAPNSTVVIDARNEGHLRAVALSGEASLIKDKEAVIIKTGEEVVDGDDMSEEEMILADGVSRSQAVWAGITKSGPKKRTIALKQVLERDIMIAGSLVHVSGCSGKLHQRYVNRIRESAQLQPNFVPAKFTQTVHSLENATVASSQAPAHPLKDRQNGAHSVMRLFADKDTNFQVRQSNFIELKNGGIFLAAPTKLTISTPLLVVTANKNANLAVEYNHDSVKVRACSGSNAVSVRVGIFDAKVSAGEELIVSKHKLSPSSFHDKLSRRETAVSRCGDLYVARSQFGIMSLISNHVYMSAVARTPSPQNATLRANLLKNAAALHYVTGHRGPYKSGSPLSMIPSPSQQGEAN